MYQAGGDFMENNIDVKTLAKRRDFVDIQNVRLSMISNSFWVINMISIYFVYRKLYCLLWRDKYGSCNNKSYYSPGDSKADI